MIVYKITNKVNNKVYIGITKRKKGFKERYSARGEGIERVYNFYLQSKNRGEYYNIHLFRAIAKYGFDNFEVEEEFDKAETIKELQEKEKYWIKYYNSDNPNYGYNNTKGGEGVVQNILTKVKKDRNYSKTCGIENVGYCGSNKTKEKNIIKELCKNTKTPKVFICKICGKLYTKDYGDIKKGFCEDCIDYEPYYSYIVEILGKLPQVEEYEKSHYKNKPRKVYSVPFKSSFVITEEYCKNNVKLPLNVINSQMTKLNKQIEDDYNDNINNMVLDMITDEEERDLFEKSIGDLSIEEAIEHSEDIKEYSKKLIKEYGHYRKLFIEKYLGSEWLKDEFNI